MDSLDDYLINSNGNHKCHVICLINDKGVVFMKMTLSINEPVRIFNQLIFLT